MQERINLEYIYGISIQDVAIRLGIEVISNSSARCFNKSNHKNNDANPSLIFGKKNTWYCAVCNFNFNGKSYGNNIDLVKEFYGIDFQEALGWFHKEFNTPLQKNYSINRYIESKQISPKDIEIYNDFIKLCGKMTGSPLWYLRSRGLDNFTIHAHRISNVTTGAVEKIKKLYTVDELLNSGLFQLSSKTNETYFPFFNYPIIFPFYYLDDVIFLQFRSLNDNQKKYINISKDILFPYNVNILLHPDISQESILIVEGVIDVLSLSMRSIQAIGLVGTTFKEDWEKLFRLYNVKPVIALDEDQRGKRSEQKIADIIKEPIQRIYPSSFGQGKDWNEILLKEKVK